MNRTQISHALLLGLASITIVFAGNDAALWENQIAAQDPSYRAVDLTPTGYRDAHGAGNSLGQQVGDAFRPGGTTGGTNHALLWRGSADSVVDLSPHEFPQSEARASCGGQQVGLAGSHAVMWRGNAASRVDLHVNGFDTTVAIGASAKQQVGLGLLDSEVGRSSHALLWRGSADTIVDLHPTGFIATTARGTSGGEQVGSGRGPATLGNEHALVWRGSAETVRDIHPAGFSVSVALGVSGTDRVGFGYGPATEGRHHALLWRGPTSTLVDLHPRGFLESEAHATSGGLAVEWGRSGVFHALLWRGSAASTAVVDLHTYLPSKFKTSMATGIDAAGNVMGMAATSPPWVDSHAILWKRAAPISPEQPSEQC